MTDAGNRDNPMVLIFAQDVCRGCLRCELACSFHNSGHHSFQPEASSTRVYRDNDTNRMTMAVDTTCDMCEHEAYILCIHACPFGARGIVHV